MANLPETSVWSDVYQLADTDDVLAADENSPANLPHLQLLQRTEYLKDRAVRMLYDDVSTGGPAGTLWTHNLGSGLYVPSFAALGDPEGQLGEVWFTIAENTLKIHNSGLAGISVRVSLVVLDNSIPA